jgi:hypothetical protein
MSCFPAPPPPAEVPAAGLKPPPVPLPAWLVVPPDGCGSAPPLSEHDAMQPAEMRTVPAMLKNFMSAPWEYIAVEILLLPPGVIEATVMMPAFAVLA